MSSFPKHWLLLAAVSCASPQTPPAAAPAASIAPAIRPSANARVAVLGLRSKLGLVDTGRLDLGYLGDRIRASALNGVPSLNIISRENVLVLLESSGKPIDECEGECEVETGRRVGADLVISGEALSVEGVFKISLKLHDTHSGRMLSGSVASGKTFQELDGDIHRAVFDLLRPAFGTPRSAPQPLQQFDFDGRRLRSERKNRSLERTERDLEDILLRKPGRSSRRSAAGEWIFHHSRNLPLGPVAAVVAASPRGRFS
jgi:hypothetical protein